MIFNLRLCYGNGLYVFFVRRDDTAIVILQVERVVKGTYCLITSKIFSLLFLRMNVTQSCSSLGWCLKMRITI